MKFFILAALALATTANAKTTGCDGYQVVKSDFVNTELQISFVLHNNKNEMIKAAYLLGAPPKHTDTQELQEFAFVKRSGSCVIHIVDPRKMYDPCFIGHAVTHCILGNYHFE
jgi:hypothetical protein